ncbi:MAG: PTS glucose transporter subunit IIA [Beduini sp.]
MFNIFKKKKTNSIIAPIDGKVIALESVPDQVFSTKMMGDGIAIDTTGDQLFAPCDGKISVIAPTLHAVGITLENGMEILIHVGLDTVTLKGAGFECLVSVGDQIKIGTPLLHINRDVFVNKGISLITPIVVCNSAQFPISSKNEGVDATAKVTPIFEY